MSKKLRTNTKKYAEEVERLDAEDWGVVLEAYAPEPLRCAGGRLVHPKYVCIHCGSESPSTTCKETVEQAIEAKRKRETDWKSFTL